MPDGRYLLKYSRVGSQYVSQPKMPRTAKSSISPRGRTVPRTGHRFSRLDTESESKSTVLAQPDPLPDTLFEPTAIDQTRRGKVTLPRRALQREYAFIVQSPLCPPAIPISAEDEIGRLPPPSPNSAAGMSLYFDLDQQSK
jgi:hypothetical protein